MSSHLYELGDSSMTLRRLDEKTIELMKRQNKLLEWMEKVLNTKLPRADNFHELLKDGVLLCKLMNSLWKDSIPNIKTAPGGFKGLDNIQKFLKRCKVLNLLPSDAEYFEPVDLYNGKNLNKVLNTLEALQSYFFSKKTEPRPFKLLQKETGSIPAPARGIYAEGSQAGASEPSAPAASGPAQTAVPAPAPAPATTPPPAATTAASGTTNDEWANRVEKYTPENIAANTWTLTESELLKELNAVRQNPAQYAELLEKEYKPYFDPQDPLILDIPNLKTVRTKEGVKAVNDAIEFLRKLSPLPPLEPVIEMTKAARECICEHGERAQVSSDSVDRLDQYGTFKDEAVELVGYGGKNARDIVLRFVVCDGDPARTKRAVLFDKRWNCVGVGTGKHESNYKTMSILTFTINFKPK